MYTQLQISKQLTLKKRDLSLVPCKVHMDKNNLFTYGYKDLSYYLILVNSERMSQAPFGLIKWSGLFIIMTIQMLKEFSFFNKRRQN